jgi:hypothetical protein
VAVVILTAGLIGGSATAVWVSVAILGSLLLLRADDRLLVAPLYGGGLLVVSELARCSMDLAGSARLGVVLAVAGGGTGAAGLAAIAVLAAPERSVAATAAGAASVMAATGTVVWRARHLRHRSRSTLAVSSAAGRDPKTRS